MDRYNRKLQAALDGTVWTAGCTNYFRGRNGKIVTQLPYSGRSYWLRTRLFHPVLYRATRYRAARATAAQPNGLVRTSASANPAARNRSGSESGSTGL